MKHDLQPRAVATQSWEADAAPFIVCATMVAQRKQVEGTTRDEPTGFRPMDGATGYMQADRA